LPILPRVADRSVKFSCGVDSNLEAVGTSGVTSFKRAVADMGGFSPTSRSSIFKFSRWVVKLVRWQSLFVPRGGRVPLSATNNKGFDWERLFVDDGHSSTLMHRVGPGRKGGRAFTTSSPRDILLQKNMYSTVARSRYFYFLCFILGSRSRRSELPGNHLSGFLRR
jgi:hypothetical protein